jgi:hypothetical protein
MELESASDLLWAAATLSVDDVDLVEALAAACLPKGSPPPPLGPLFEGGRRGAPESRRTQAEERAQARAEGGEERGEIRYATCLMTTHYTIKMGSKGNFHSEFRVEG